MNSSDAAPFALIGFDGSSKMTRSLRGVSLVFVECRDDRQCGDVELSMIRVPAEVWCEESFVTGSNLIQHGSGVASCFIGDIGLFAQVNSIVCSMECCLPVVVECHLASLKIAV